MPMTVNWICCLPEMSSRNTWRWSQKTMTEICHYMNITGASKFHITEPRDITLTSHSMNRKICWSPMESTLQTAKKNPKNWEHHHFTEDCSISRIHICTAQTVIAATVTKMAVPAKKQMWFPRLIIKTSDIFLRLQSLRSGSCLPSALRYISLS